MIQGLRGVILTLLATLACPALAYTQEGPAQEDAVRQAVRVYQTKVDQLEQLTKKVLASRKQQFEAAAAAQRRLERGNRQLSTLVDQLRGQLATANAERNRLQRSLKEREAENKALEDRLVKTKKKDVRQPEDVRGTAQLHRLEDQVTKMEQWVQELRRDVQALLRRRPQEREEAEEEEEEAEEQKAPAIHIHNHGGPVILHFHGGSKPQVVRHDDDGDGDSGGPRVDRLHEEVRFGNKR
jgi:chromosome segregation ATPase